jgi:Protein of unknown function (DUF4230)
MTTESDPRDGSTELITRQGDQPMVVYVREPKSWGRRLLVFVGVLGILVASYFGLKAVDLWPKIRNPFATETTDRSSPVLLQSIQDLSRYVAAQGNFQVIVDLQENKRFVPDLIFNDHTLFIGVGSVDAYVDFASLTDGAIVISPDGSSVEITLPAPVLEKPSMDNDESRVYDEDRGLLNIVGDLVGNDPNKRAQLYQLAEAKIAEAAQQSALAERAEINTRAMLESLLHQLGYERVTIIFVKP